MCKEGKNVRLRHAFPNLDTIENPIINSLERIYMYIYPYTHWGRRTHHVQVDYVLGKVTHVPGSQEILNWMAIGVSTVHGGKWDDKGNFKAFVMLLATNKVDHERLVGLL